ncbi:MAG: 30S ribosomal protein S16 [Patescibacteria group bacterium]|nr:30S ribosomal protein S16 [Patescibacteria group bacterium]
MLVIRLTRTGKKNASSFRIVLTEKQSAAKSGKFLEVLGSYNPRLLVKKEGAVAGGKEITLKKERIEYWLSQGAKASDTVHNLLVGQGIVKGPKIAKKIKPKKGKPAQESEKPSADAQSEEEPVEEKKEDKEEHKVDKPKEKE